jgi:hypothetical protein
MSVTLSSKLKLNELGEKGNPSRRRRLWECGKLAVVCELSKAVWEERERAFAFPLFPYCRHFHSPSLPAGRHRLQDELMTIKSRQGEGCKMNVPVAIIGRLHADEFSSQTLADKDLCALPEEGSIRINSLGLHAGVVLRCSNSIRIAARRTVVARGRRLLLQRLMRAFLVELLAESIKSLLLRSPVGRWRFRRLGLQRPMHALVTPILLRMTWLDPLRRDAQLHPVDR